MEEKGVLGEKDQVNGGERRKRRPKPERTGNRIRGRRGPQAPPMQVGVEEDPLGVAEAEGWGARALPPPGGGKVRCRGERRAHGRGSEGREETNSPKTRG